MAKRRDSLMGGNKGLKAVLMGVAFLMILVIIFITAYIVKSSSIDDEVKDMTKEQVEEMDNLEIDGYIITYNNAKFTEVSAFRDALLQNKIEVSTLSNQEVRVDLTYGSGKEDKNLKAYVTNGSDNKIEKNGSFVHIVVDMGTVKDISGGNSSNDNDSDSESEE